MRVGGRWVGGGGSGGYGLWVLTSVELPGMYREGICYLGWMSVRVGK